MKYLLLILFLMGGCANLSQTQEPSIDQGIAGLITVQDDVGMFPKTYPYANMTVIAFGPEDLSQWRVDQGQVTILAQTITNENGQFELALEQGDYVICAGQCVLIDIAMNEVIQMTISPPWQGITCKNDECGSIS